MTKPGKKGGGDVASAAMDTRLDLAARLAQLTRTLAADPAAGGLADTDLAAVAEVIAVTEAVADALAHGRPADTAARLTRLAALLAGRST